MNRIDQLFAKKQHNVLNVYCTAGFPTLDSTLPVMQALQDAGADLIELGMPFSDPLADGPVIQDSSMKAIQNGMTLVKLFEQLKDFRQHITLPVILMGYLNPILQMGVEKFCEQCAAVGVDGLIVPELPIPEFEAEYQAIFTKYGLHMIFLVTPETSEERIRRIDAVSKGFLYAVSSSSTTGKDKNIGDQSGYFKKLKGLQLKNPVLIGFGIKDKSTFTAACEYSNGAIIGTAFIKAIGEANGSLAPTVKAFIQGIIA